MSDVTRGLESGPDPTKPGDMMLGDVDLASSFDISFLASPLRQLAQLDVLDLLGSWDAQQPASQKRLRLSISLSQSRHILFASSGAMDFHDLVAMLEESTTSTDQTTTAKDSKAEHDVFFVNDEVIRELNNDDQAMTNLTATVDHLSQELQRERMLSAVVPAPPKAVPTKPVPTEPSMHVVPVSVAVSNGNSKSLERLRDHFRDRFASEVELQVKQVAKRRRTNLHPQATERLTAFVKQRAVNPYATQAEKEQLALACGITAEQVSNWVRAV